MLELVASATIKMTEWSPACGTRSVVERYVPTFHDKLVSSSAVPVQCNYRGSAKIWNVCMQYSELTVPADRYPKLL